MLCSLPLTACDTERVAVPIKPPPERLECLAAGERPAVPAEHVIDWSQVEVPGDSRATLDKARGEVVKLVASIRSREGVVAGYVVRIEGLLFACSSNAAWLRDFYAGQ
jgi:hypothetical protein